MPAPPHNWHLCAFCKRVVGVIEGGRTVREMALSESGLTVKDFDEPGGGHGICTECDKAERALLQKIKAARQHGRVVENNPKWAVDHDIWKRAVRIVRRSYGV